MPSLQFLARHSLTPSVTLLMARGSVLDFEPRGLHVSKSAVVNAANPSCLGGGGVDGAITAAGGPQLAADRLRLPVRTAELRSAPWNVDPHWGDGEIRCPTGSAVLTGPNEYGTLPTPYVIHAVGPNYHDFAPEQGEYDDCSNEAGGWERHWSGAPLPPIEDGHALLQSAYAHALDLAAMHGIRQVAFPLLSAGVFRASVPLERVLELAITAVADWSRSADFGRSKPASLEVVLCAYAPEECRALVRVGQRVLQPATEEDAGSPAKDETASPRLEATQVEL